MMDINKLLESERIEVSFVDRNVTSEDVKSFRREHKLTQVALANILGVKKKTIEKWEQGVNNINGSSAVLIKLLSEHSELIDELYRVRTGVVGKPVSEEFKLIDRKIINAPVTYYTDISLVSPLSA